MTFEIVLPKHAPLDLDRLVKVPFKMRLDGPSASGEIWTLVDLETDARAGIRTLDVYRRGIDAVNDAVEELKKHRRFAGDLLTRHWHDGEE